MTELKAYIAPTPDGTGLADYYLKSEVDAVFEELKIKVKVKTHDIEVARKLKTSYLIDYAEALKRESHHKYKRCLAMADYCYTNVHCIMGHRLCALSDRKKEWFERWHKRWLELAEKFKEVK